MSENVFESGKQKVIPAVLVYIFRNDQVLMMHRVPASSTQVAQVDFHEGKWNGLGGKLEKNESLEAAQREVLEESGLKIPEEYFHSLGVLQFPNFKPHKSEDWMVFVFKADISTELGEVPSRTQEGELHWVSKQDILKLNLWPGDRSFLPYVLESRPFMGTIWYQGAQVERVWIHPLTK